MIARAPGKLVLSGAYAVLAGAPAIVAAVDRYVVADSSRTATFVTPEVRQALGDRRAPWFDAAPLRDSGQKLGLGSSAAILVASLAALTLDEAGALEDQRLAEAVLEPALEAHARAQQGGSGIDVAASALGGVLVAQRSPEGLRWQRVTLPDGIHLEVWASGQPASTRELLAQVDALARKAPAQHAELMARQSEAAEAGRRAVTSGDAAALVVALRAQHVALAALGTAAGAPIVTVEVAELGAVATAEGASVLPSGAGGGDITLLAGTNPPSEKLLAHARRLGQRRLSLDIGARGVHAGA